MKDIKIRTNGKGNVDIITHGEKLGYGLDEDHKPYLLKSNYIFVSEHKGIKWSDSETIFNNEMCEEMTPTHFMEYKG
jgi:hypothetical protein